MQTLARASIINPCRSAKERTSFQTSSLSSRVSTSRVSRPRICIRKCSDQTQLRSISRSEQSVYSTAVDESIEALQKNFGIDGYVEIVAGMGGLPKVILTHSSGASAEIYLFGACITSWKQANGSEVLYVRPDAKFDKSKAISGGVPVCFPQFGPGELPQHGFARDSDWAIASTSADLQPDERDPEVEFILSSTPATMEIYPHPFKVAYSISLHGETLKTEYRVINEGDSDMHFTGALHSYFEVTDVEKAKVSGLQGSEFLDKIPDANNPKKSKMEEKQLEFHGPVDSVFLNVPGLVQLDVGGNGAGVEMTFEGWKDVVCWSPWTEMPACYKEFVCVENAVFDPVLVPTGASWRGATNFQVVDI